MSFKDGLRRIVLRATGLHVYRTPPRGTDFFADVRKSLPHFRPRVIFDVGANIGQTTAEYRREYPLARIVAFEPIAGVADMLAQRFSGDDRVTVERLALGDRTGDAHMQSADRSVASRMQPLGSDGELVSVETLDDYARRSRQFEIDFLKIDTEGHDLAVVQGARNSLSEGRIGMVQVEAGMSPDNELHVPLEFLKATIEAHRYRLFGMYEQVREFPMKGQQLRRVNAVFVSPHLLERHRGDL